MVVNLKLIWLYMMWAGRHAPPGMRGSHNLGAKTLTLHFGA